MKKFYYYLFLIVVISSCDKNDEVPSKNQVTNYPKQLYIINGDIEYYADITDGSKPKKPIFIYDIPKELNDNETNKNLGSKSSAQSTFINFNYGLAGPTNSGCTINKYVQSKGSYYTTDAGVYGFNPSPQDNGYLVRGFSLPHHNQYYNSLVLFANNRGVTKSSRGSIYNDNISRGAAISIEYPFKANVTYEISILSYFVDNKQIVDKKNSEGFPTLHAQLKDSGILINGPSSCETEGIFRIIESNPNNLKSYTLENNMQVQRTIVFKFSPIEQKNALLLALHPTTSEQRGPDVKIPTNSYTMVLKNITIVEKAFDPSLNTEISGRGVDTRETSGRR